MRQGYCVGIFISFDFTMLRLLNIIRARSGHRFIRRWSVTGWLTVANLKFRLMLHDQFTGTIFKRRKIAVTGVMFWRVNYAKW
jgi:hypothetical protein